MDHSLRFIADTVITSAIQAVLPDDAVRRGLENVIFPGRVILVAAGKAAWQMAKAASSCLKGQISQGILITKYGHVGHTLENIQCLEAGHPVPDDNTFQGTKKILEMTQDLRAEDTVLFLLSGGGSALFE